MDQRRKIYNELDFELSAMSALRTDISAFLGVIDDVIDKKNIWTEQTMLQYLRTIENLTNIENISLPVLDATEKSAKCFHLINDSLDDISRQISTEYTATNQLHEEEKAVQRQVKFCDTLLRETILNTNLTSDFQSKRGMMEEINEATKVLVKDLPKRFTRPLNDDKISSIDTSNDDCYEEENELLDKVLNSDEENIFPFQLVHRYFTTPSDLLTQLCIRFCNTPPVIEPSHPKQLVKTQEKVLEFLLVWVSNFNGFTIFDITVFVILTNL